MKDENRNSDVRELSRELFNLSSEELLAWEAKVFQPEAMLDRNEADRLSYLCMYSLRHLRKTSKLEGPHDELVQKMSANFGLSQAFCLRVLRGGQALLDDQADVSEIKIRRPDYSGAFFNFGVGVGLVLFLWFMETMLEASSWWSVPIYGIGLLTVLMLPPAIWVHLSESFTPRSGKSVLREHDNVVLYLRSHADEGHSLGRYSTVFGMGAASIERAIEEVLEEYNTAPIAILNPSDQIEPIANFYWVTIGSGYSWQDAVLFLMAIAKVVVINTGDTEWVKWEAELARTKIDPRKVVMLVRGEKVHLADVASPVERLTAEGMAEMVSETPNFNFQLGINMPRTPERRIVSMLVNAIMHAAISAHVTYDTEAGPEMGRSEFKLKMLELLTYSQEPVKPQEGEHLVQGTRIRMAPIEENTGKADELVNEGNALLSAKDLSGAKAKYEAALVEDPSLLRAHFNLGNTLLLLGEHDAAIPALRRARELGPGDARVHNSLGQVLLLAERKEEAETAFREALAWDETHAGALVGLGKVLIERGAYTEARTYFERAQEEGEDVRAFLNLIDIAPR